MMNFLIILNNLLIQQLKEKNGIKTINKIIIIWIKENLLIN